MVPGQVIEISHDDGAGDQVPAVAEREAQSSSDRGSGSSATSESTASAVV